MDPSIYKTWEESTELPTPPTPSELTAYVGDISWSVVGRGSIRLFIPMSTFNQKKEPFPVLKGLTCQLLVNNTSFKTG